MRNLLLVISGPSGVGKGTIAKRLCEMDKNTYLSVSCTTRAPREREIDGKDYIFISKEQFQNKINENGFLEYSNHFENFYGTPKDLVVEKLKTGDVILEIDVNGGLNVKKAYPEAVLIMILPPSLEELRNRLIKRGTESIDKINLRMQRIDFELSRKSEYNYSLVNDDLEKTVLEIRDIINKEKNS